MVSQSSLDVMFTPLKEEYGYGWFITDMFNRKVTMHGGGISGFATAISRFVDDKTVVILLSNIEDAPLDEISLDLIAIAFEEE
jgi:hypothetical protein